MTSKTGAGSGQGQTKVVQQKARSGGESSKASTSSSMKSIKTTPLQSNIALPAASTSKASASTSSSATPSGSSSLHASPRPSTLNTFSAPIHFTTENIGTVEQPQQSSSPRLGNASAAQNILGFNPSINGNNNNTQYTSAQQSRMRASTSTLPSNAYATANQAALLQSLPASAHIVAQAATAAAVAANMAASSQYYRSMTSSSASSPSSSTRLPLQHPYLFQHQPYQPIAYEKHTVELTNCVIAFLSPILPTEEEYRIKEATRRQLERLAGRVSPGAKLLAFGSMANGFALRNSDMDLCCLIAGAEDDTQKKPAPSASELVEVLGKLIREETDYTVMPLPKARIPIIKISRAPTSELPYEISCDIGFENRLALENTRLLLTYAMVDPPRLRTLVLFLKVWTKRRKLNSPYTGTLSSYGYTLLMIFFLTHVKRPSVLPNLQQISPSSNSTRKENVELNGHNIYFYDDVATLRREWTSGNTENVGELLIDFFRYFSKEFVYSKDVISIRTEAGLRAKDGQVWSSELCIEDPFQAGYNVARTVTRDGLYTIRGEFMRASRILNTRSERVSSVLAELCEEREDGLTRAPDTPYYQRHRSSFASPSAFHNTASASTFDPRYLQDLTKRYDLSNSATSGFGGSFAFEEMARGLGQAQKSTNAMAYPPTTAMLAPLSQNTGLSPRQHLMRAGLRYDTPRRGQTGAPTNITTGSINLVGSSTRSEDGNGNYDKKMTKKSSASSNVSAHTSPNIDNAMPSFLQTSDAAAHDGYGVGEALAFGSEISFGSQRFQLHPQSTIAASRSTPSRAGEEDPRAIRSFSEGLNRSLSLPRPGAEVNEKRRSSTPLLSEPTSPSKLVVSTNLPDQNKYLEPSMGALSLQDRQTSHRSSLSDSGANKRISVPIFTSQSGHSNQLGGLGDKMQMTSSSPYLPPSPWSSADPDNQSRDSRIILTPEEDGSFGLDDEPASISDAGESGRLETSHDQSEAIEPTDEPHQDLSHGKEHAIRSWAASQSVGIRNHTDV